MLGISLQTEQLLASQQGHSFMELTLKTLN